MGIKKLTKQVSKLKAKAARKVAKVDTTQMSASAARTEWANKVTKAIEKRNVAQGRLETAKAELEKAKAAKNVKRPSLSLLYRMMDQAKDDRIKLNHDMSVITLTEVEQARMKDRMAALNEDIEKIGATITELREKKRAKLTKKLDRAKGKSSKLKKRLAAVEIRALATGEKKVMENLHKKVKVLDAKIGALEHRIENL